jgi:hypothetical protein
MKTYCRLKSKSDKKGKTSAFVSRAKSPSLLALSTRPLSRTHTEHFLSDQDMREGLGVLKSCVLYDFEAIFAGENKYSFLIEEMKISWRVSLGLNWPGSRIKEIVCTSK